MATTKVGIAPMKAAQVPKPGADFEIVEREIPNPVAGEVRIKIQACGVATVTCSRKKARGPAFSIHAFQDTKSRASLMNWAPALPSGRRANASGSAGTGAMTIRVVTAA